MTLNLNWFKFSLNSVYFICYNDRYNHESTEKVEDSIFAHSHKLQSVPIAIQS